METAAHKIHFLDNYRESGKTLAQLATELEERGYQTLTRQRSSNTNPGDPEYVFPYSLPDPLPSDIIQWIRVYKNPKIVPRAELTKLADSNVGPVLSFAAYDISLTSQLLPSYKEWNANLNDPTLFWVQFKPTDHPDAPGGLIDTGENSGRVTTTENTSVAVGDMIAIAVRTKGLGRQASPDMAIGPLVTRVYDTVNDADEQHVITLEERQWCLNPNLPMNLISDDNRWRLWIVTELPNGYEHTFVYPFRVEVAHVALNAEGPWLKKAFTPTATQVSQQVYGQPSAGAPSQIYTILTPQGFDWLYGESEGVPPSATAVKPFNTFQERDA